MHGYLHKRVQRGSGRPEEYRERSRKRERPREFRRVVDSFALGAFESWPYHAAAAILSFFVPLSFSLVFQIALTPLFSPPSFRPVSALLPRGGLISRWFLSDCSSMATRDARFRARPTCDRRFPVDIVGS